MEELQLTEAEVNDLMALKRCTPFRDWHAVKVPGEPHAVMCDSRRKALGLLRKYPGAKAWKAG